MGDGVVVALGLTGSRRDSVALFEEIGGLRGCSAGGGEVGWDGEGGVGWLNEGYGIV